MDLRGYFRWNYFRLNTCDFQGKWTWETFDKSNNPMIIPFDKNQA